MSGRVYLGFDPGMAGAVAAIYPDGEAVVFDMPTVATVRTRREVVARELANIVAPLAVGGDAVAVLEQPFALPMEARQTTLAIGRNAGIIEGVLAALGIPYESIRPDKWKPAMGLPKGALKDASRARAMALFPALAERLSRKKDDGRAEALLLAEWRRRQG